MSTACKIERSNKFWIYYVTIVLTGNIYYENEQVTSTSNKLR